MTGVSVLTILIFTLHNQASYGQQNGVAASCQPAVHNNVGFSQTADQTNLNIQMQQSAKQAPSSQQSYNLQQLANIPMQTFNVQQPVNFQQQANTPPPNFQPLTQATVLQQIPQSMNIQEAHDVQQSLSSPVNLQNAPAAQTVSTQQTINGRAAPPSVIIQHQPHPVQAANFQQAYPVNLQQQIQTPSPQPQTPQQCVNLQKSVVMQPGSLQQQTVVRNGNAQQVQQHQTNFQQPSQPYINLQQQSAHVQQPAVIVQPVTAYQQPVTFHEPVVKQLNVQKCTIQEPNNSQQVQIQQTDPQQKQFPCQAIGGYQVVSYQKPCQPDVAAALPLSVQLSKVSTNPYPAVITAMPATMPDSDKIARRTDHVYLVNPQNYVNSASYSAYTPQLVMDDVQQVVSGPPTPIGTLPNSNPSSTINFVISNPSQCAETIDNRSSSAKTSDLGILSLLQGQFPVTSLLSQPTSSFESALLSSILSSIQSPPSTPQYVMANYPTQTVLGPQCNSQNSKFSLKSLLPLLLNLLQEKYSGSGCQCQCCNCDRSQNDIEVHESRKSDNEGQQEDAETTEEVPIDNEDYLEEEDIPVNPRHREKSKYQNMISDDTEEIDETEDCSSGIETEDVGTGSGDEEDFSNDSSKL